MSETITRRRLTLPTVLAAGLVAGLVQPTAATVLDVSPIALELHHLEGVILYIAVVFHLLYSALFAAVFVGVGRALDLEWGGNRPLTTVLAGLGFALALWALAVALAWPVGLHLFGAPSAPAVPHVHRGPLVGHVVYGLGLGTAICLVSGGRSD